MLLFEEAVRGMRAVAIDEPDGIDMDIGVLLLFEVMDMFRAVVVASFRTMVKL